MSNRTRKTNEITTTIISIFMKLMVYALIILLLYGAVARGYALGHEIFFTETVDEAPGQDMIVRIDSKESVSDTAQLLARRGLTKSEFAFIFQSRFYDYETIHSGTYILSTSMTSREILRLLNEKPETEDSAEPAQSGGARAAEAKTTQGRTSEGGSGGSAASGQETSLKIAAILSSDAGIPTDVAPGSQAEANAIDAQEVRTNEQIYEGEDQEMEGGRIGDVAEDGTQ